MSRTVLKTNADAYSLDLTGLEVHPMSSTSIGGPGYINLELICKKFTDTGDKWDDPRARVSLKLNSAQMAKVLVQMLAELTVAHPRLVREAVSAEWAIGNEWMHYLYRAVDPAYFDFVLEGHCSTCQRPARARLADGQPDVWIHLGLSCGPSEGVFALGEGEYAVR